MAYDIGPKIGIEGEAAFRKAINDLNTSFKTLGTEMSAVTSAFDKNDKSSKALTAQNGVLNKQIDTQKQKLIQLNSGLAQSTEKYGAADKVTQGWQQAVNKATAELNNMDRELAANNKSIDTQNSNWTKMGKSLDTIGTKMKTVGEGMSSVGQKLSLAVTAPIIGLGVASIKTGMDFESGMSKVKAISGATGDSFQKLNDQALQLGQDTAFSAGQAAEGMQNLASAGFNVEEIMKAMPGMLDLAASGGLDIATASDIASSALRSFGLGADQSGHFADVLAKAAADTNANVTDMGMSLKYAAAPAYALGMSVEEVSAAIGIMADAGIKGEQAGTTLRGSLLALASPSGPAADAMKAIGLEVFDATGKMLPFKDVIGAVTESTKNLTQEEKVNALATIFGREAVSGMMVLIEKGPAKFDKLTKSFKDSDGAAKKMATTMQDNAKSSIEQMMGSLETAAIKIGQAVAPTIRKLAEWVQELANKFSNLSPEMQGTIIKIALAVAVVGPLLVAFGSVVTALGAIATFFGPASIAIGAGGAAAGVATPAVAGLGASFGAALLPLLPFILGIGAVIAAGVLLYNHFKKDAIPTVQLYGKETSDATKKAVGAYMDLDDKATKSLMSLEFSGKAVSKETADALTKNFDDMGTQIKAGMDKHFGDSFKTMQDFFANSSALTTTEEAAALAAMTKNNENQKAGIEEREKAIKLILDTASVEKRALTQDEQIKINNIQANMKTNAVNALSETELESLAILERMKAQTGDVTARQAAEVAQNSIKQKNKAIENANAQYTETIKAIIKQRDETGTISNDQANRLIKDAVRQKNESVAAATEMNNKVVEQAKLQSGAHIKEVDWETGQIKSKWQVMVDTNKAQNEEIKKNVGAKWAEITTQFKSDMNNIGTICSSKWAGIKTQFSSDMNSIGTTFSSKWSSIKTQFGKDMDNIKNIASGAIAAIKGFFTNLHLPSIKIPHIDLPHFSISGSFSLVPPKIPSIGVSWYDKGGVFNSPTVIGVGEKRPEFVGALDDLKDIFREVMGEKKGTPQIIFQGSYSFADKTDIDYFMNKAAVLVKRRT